MAQSSIWGEYFGIIFSKYVLGVLIRIISMRQIYWVPIKQKFLCKNTEEIIPELAVITQNTPIICSSESEWENFEMMCQLGSQNVLTTSGFKIRDPWSKVGQLLLVHHAEASVIMW